MNKTELSKLLNNRAYRFEITKEEEKLAKENNLIVIFGYSDDGVEIRGAINDEVGAYNGTSFKIDIEKKKIIEENILLENIEDEYIIDILKDKFKNFPEIEIEYDKNDYNWWIESKNIDFETFDILEDGEKFCRGIILDLK